MQGQIQAVDSRPSQYGTMWRVQINGSWMGAGKVQPPPVGTMVNYDATQNARGYWDAKNIVPVQGGAPAASTPQYAPNANGGGFRKGAGKPYTGGKSQEEKDYWNKRDAKEELKEKHYQARWALSQGMEFAIKAAQAGYLKLASKNPEEQREQILVLGAELAEQFLAEATKLASGGSSVPSPEGDPEQAPPEAEGEDGDWSE